MSFDVQKIRNDFPILNQKIYNNQLVYLDSAATTQKPVQVLDAVYNFYKTFNANIHRGVYYLSEKSTDLYEQSREKVREFINAKKSIEVIFTSGTTESINLLASTLGNNLNEGDEILVSEMEHHANIVPWHILREKKGIIIKVIPFTDDFQIDLDEFQKLFTEKTKLVSVVHISNSLGTINPIDKIIEISHKHNTKVIVDAAQSIQHFKIDVQKSDIDFLVFSGHKIYAETGIGVLYGKEDLLKNMSPYKGGGDMIKDVSFEEVEFAELPFKFEAGTTNFAGALSLKTAIEYIQNIGLENIGEYETKLHNYCLEKIKNISDLQLYCTSKSNKASIVSFNVKGIHNSDIGTLLDKYSIAVRTGGHCTYPIMKKLGIPGTVRASFTFYNTFEEVDYFVTHLQKVVNMLK